MANPLLGLLEGVDPENLDFLSPNGTHFACSHFRTRKGLNFQSPTLGIDLSASKSLRPTPYKQQGTLIVNFFLGKISLSFTKPITCCYAKIYKANLYSKCETMIELCTMHKNILNERIRKNKNR